MQTLSRRRLFSLTARAAAGFGAVRLLGFPGPATAAEPRSGESSPALRRIDAFVERHLREIGAPGLTLGIADRDGILAVRTYGHSDIKTGAPVRSEQLFQIGSITKSFVGLCALQLREEGKLDLDRPVREILPWLRVESAHAPITVHHLLTHTSGLPNPLSLPLGPLWTGHAPGEHFHYCNVGYEILGLMLQSIERRPLSEIFRARIFQPLGMGDSSPVITQDIRPRLPESYWPLFDDRPFPRHGALTEAPYLVMDNAAGCIAATPRDMALYMRMLLNRGRFGSGPEGRLVSEESFARFITPAIPAPSFGPGSGYGYGIAVQPVEGRTLLRHTGGMVSFSSALQVDLDAGLGVFASVNANLGGYRPNAVAAYALAALRAERGGLPLPADPEPEDRYRLENAAEYAGTYTSPQGGALVFVAQGDLLKLSHRGELVPLERIAPDAFLAEHPDFALFPLVFERAEGAVVEVSHGSDWYPGIRYTGPRSFAPPPEWQAFAGHYRNENPWYGSVRVVLRKGRLLFGGGPLVPLAPGLFRLGEEEHAPDRVRFDDLAGGWPLRLLLSGIEFRRVES